MENYAKTVIYLCNSSDEINKSNLNRINGDQTIGRLD